MIDLKSTIVSWMVILIKKNGGIKSNIKNIYFYLMFLIVWSKLFRTFISYYIFTNMLLQRKVYDRETIIFTGKLLLIELHIREGGKKSLSCMIQTTQHLIFYDINSIVLLLRIKVMYQLRFT